MHTNIKHLLKIKKKSTESFYLIGAEMFTQIDEHEFTRANV